MNNRPEATPPPPPTSTPEQNSSRIAPESEAPGQGGQSPQKARKSLLQSILAQYPGQSPAAPWQKMEIIAASWEAGKVRLVFDQMEGPGMTSIDFPIHEPVIGEQATADLTQVLIATGNPKAINPEELIGSVLFMYFPHSWMLLPSRPLEVFPVSALYGQERETL